MFTQTMWMLTDFTAENSGTRVVPDSHRWGKRSTIEVDPIREVTAEGPAGSLLIWNGFLWHRTTANKTIDRHRLGPNIAHISKYIHRSQNWMWPDLPVAIYQSFPKPLQALLKRSVEPD